MIASIPNSKETILIVDDNPDNLRLLSQVLIQNGKTVRVANSGERALESIRASLPDLILLDIMMPDMDGYEICQHLKADDRTRGIPIIFLSALNTTADKVKAFTTGGVDYVSKPFQPLEILARVDTHLALRNLQRQLQIANDELKNKVAELQIQNAELDAFSHTVAHDLKNPLVSIITAASWIASDVESMSKVEIREKMEVLLQKGYKLNEIIESLLLLAGVRKQQVMLVPVDMGAALKNAQQRLAEMIESYQPQFIIPTDWPSVIGYAPWVEEIWTNYLSNALKYGGRPPRVELGVDQPNGEQSWIRFWVRDNGPGLTPEQQAALFVPFTRLHKSRAEGHGLGLSIVLRIVEKLGGQAGVESVLGQGSTFYFTLPAHKAG